MPSGGSKMTRKCRKNTPAKHPIVFRVTDEELSIIDENDQMAGLTRADYLRRRTVGYYISPKPSYYDKEAIRQLKKVGNNLNQLTKHFHIEGYVTGSLESLSEDIRKSLRVLVESD